MIVPVAQAGQGMRRRQPLRVFWAIAGARAAAAKGASLAAAPRQPFTISRAQLCALSLAHAALSRGGLRIKGDSVFRKHCPRGERGGKRERHEMGRTPTRKTATATVVCQLSFHLPGCPGSGGRKAGRGSSAPGWRRLGLAGAAGRGHPNPASEPRSAGEPAGGRGAAAAREGARSLRPVLWRRAPPPGAAGNRGYLGSRALSVTLALCGPRTN